MRCGTMHNLPRGVLRPFSYSGLRRRESAVWDDAQLTPWSIETILVLRPKKARECGVGRRLQWMSQVVTCAVKRAVLVMETHVSALDESALGRASRQVSHDRHLGLGQDLLPGWLWK